MSDTNLLLGFPLDAIRFILIQGIVKFRIDRCPLLAGLRIT